MHLHAIEDARGELIDLVYLCSRNGHGAGFWDRGLGDLGERLSDAAKVYGPADDHRPYDCGDGTADA